MGESSLRGVLLKPLYTIRFSYPDGWEVKLQGPGEGAEERHFYFAEGRCEGVISGEFRGANHPRRRVDRNFEMDLQGFIKTDDGALIMTDFKGYGRTHRQADEPGRRQVVGAAWHTSDTEKYRWLNDTVCAISGEVRAPAVPSESFRQGDVKLVFDVAEVVWEKPAE